MLNIKGESCIFFLYLYDGLKNNNFETFLIFFIKSWVIINKKHLSVRYLFILRKSLFIYFIPDISNLILKIMIIYIHDFTYSHKKS